MKRLHLYSDIDRSRARAAVLGSLTILTLVGTFVLDFGLPAGISVWALYCLAIVLALQWKGRSAIAIVAAISMTLMFLDLWWGPRGDLETGITNRVIGAITITGVALACLYIDWRRRRVGQALKSASMSRSRLRLFFNSLNDSGIVLTDIRARITEWSAGAQQLTGYPTEESVGQPLFRRLPCQNHTVVRWSHLCRQARLDGEAVQEAAYHCHDGSWRWIHIVIRPLRNRFGSLRGYSMVMHDLTSRKGIYDASDKKRGND